MPLNGPKVNRKAIARDLRKFGLRRGDIVELHVSLKSIGQVAGGARTVVHAFQDILGESGTLLMPAFSYSFDRAAEPFQPEKTPVKTGAVAETFRSMPGVVRSLCPIHSVAAWGRRAIELAWRHPITTTLGVGSPFHLAAKAGGKIVLLGCTQNSNSFLHVIESLTHHPLLYDVSPFGASCGLVLQDDGRTRRVGLTEFTGCSKSFENVQPYLDEHGLVSHGQVGAAPTRVMKGNRLIAKLVPLLKRRPDYLLCRPGCKACDKRRQYIAVLRSRHAGTGKGDIHIFRALR
jgi:aminoglycoside 3-N-acetyltransferase